MIIIHKKKPLNVKKMSQSSWKDQIKQKWGPHLHCPICGKAMPPDKKLCSQACRDNYIKTEKKQKKKSRYQMIFLVAMMAVMMILMFFVFPAFG
jgi:predicted nucleic acid-binding Zn ribbon protein